MNYTELESKIKSMTAKEIILAMVDSLKNPVMQVSMSDWGYEHNGICYGCAAANTICKLGKLDPFIEYGYVENPFMPKRKYFVQSDFIAKFEDAINDLRMGILDDYNYTAYRWGFAEIQVPETWQDWCSTAIYDDNYQDPEALQIYIDLANYQTK